MSLEPLPGSIRLGAVCAFRQREGRKEVSASVLPTHFPDIAKTLRVMLSLLLLMPFRIWEVLNAFRHRKEVHLVSTITTSVSG